MSRRVVILAGSVALASACAGTSKRRTTPTAGDSAGGPTPSTSTPAHDPDWVRAENAHGGTTAWRIPAARLASEEDLAGYADRVSVLPGEPFGLHLSSTLGPVSVTAFRLGFYEGAGAREVWRSGRLPATEQRPPSIDRLGTVCCAWPVTTTVSTEGWPEGSYLLHLQAGGLARYVPITLRSADASDRLVLVSAVTSYQAYNEWGGYSLYKGPDGSFATRARAVSYDRPYDRSGASHVLNHELGPIRLAESVGLDLAYQTSWDLHDQPHVLARARGVVSLGHDEYWSVPSRRAVEEARDAGSNVAFLGANALYWRVRFDATGRLMTCYKSAAEDPVMNRMEKTGMWRADPDPDPENSLTGMLYEAFPADADLAIHDPQFFLFEGLGLRRGSAVPGIVATEIDRAYPVAGTPKNLQVVAHSPVPIAGRPPTHSDMTYYTTSSDAGVLAVGTMGWCLALRGTSRKHRIDHSSVEFARTVTRRLFKAMAQGPLGKAHPARGNLDSIGASPMTSTGTGGPVAFT